MEWKKRLFAITSTINEVMEDTQTTIQGIKPSIWFEAFIKGLLHNQQEQAIKRVEALRETACDEMSWKFNQAIDMAVKAIKNIK